MKTYAAITALGQDKLRIFNESRYDRFLVSFLYDKNRNFFPRIEYPFTGMLDSGAHSAWTKGATIDLGQYIEWALAYAIDFPDVRVTNLDVIPGEKGRLVPTRKEQLAAVEQSAENAAAIRAAGLRVVEVHHLADPPASLDRMIERRQPGEVIGIGGLTEQVKSKNGVLSLFGDSVFSRLRDVCGYDHFPPVHGFGISISSIGYRYPLASIDASSWVAPEQYGQTLSKGLLRTRKSNSRYLRHGDMKTYETKRILELWKSRESKIRNYWLSRGITIEAEGAALVDGTNQDTARPGGEPPP